MQTIREVMSADPITISSESTVAQAAQIMRDESIGGIVIVDDDESIQGIITDRDVTTRAVAQGYDPSSTSVSEICSSDPITISAEDGIDDAITLMREHSVRRLPVTEEDGSLVGIVSLGDLAIERDPSSVLGTISAASPNN